MLTHLTVEHATTPLALHTRRPRFSWWIDPDLADGRAQAAYQVIVDGVIDTGRVESAESAYVDVLADHVAPSTRYDWRVRLWLQGSDEPSEWASSWFETARDLSDWPAQWLDPAQEPVTADGSMSPFAPNPNTAAPEDKLHPPAMIRQEFTLDEAPVSARLRMTAQGVYQAELNGRPVGDEVLAPGYEGYHKLISVQTYDVTDQLQAGANTLGAILGDGWFAGRIAFTGLSRQYGDRLRLTWVLEVTDAEGRVREILPDSTARSTHHGPIRYADIFIGESYDARRELPGWGAPGFDASGWDKVELADVSENLVPFVGEPVRRVMEVPAVEVISTPAGECVVDFGQVLAGRVRLTVTGEAGTTITLEHAEVLDAHGNFLNNIAGCNKDQTDHYTLRGGGPETWEPTFTFHGFRYVRLTGWPDTGGTPDASAFTAVVLASDLAYGGEWESSDPRLNQLHRNVVWSQRANLLAVPTDCPQRERAGWTGDIQIFAPAATNNADVTAFLSRWLRNARAEQWDDGMVPIIVPMPRGMDFSDNGGDGTPKERPDDEIFDIDGAAGWGDAIVFVPHALWRRAGDLGVVEDNWDAMVAWIDYQTRAAAQFLPKRLRDTELDPASRANHEIMWNGVFNFGDWLTPSLSDATDPQSIMIAPRRTSEYMGPFYQGQSLTLMAEMARATGREAEASDYERRAGDVRRAWAEEYLDAEGRIPEPLMGVSVLALAFGFVPDEHMDAVRAHLVQTLHDNGDRLDTGFLSVAHLLPALWSAGETDLARTVLWQPETPSWLYEVDHGATTIWESWDAVKPDGTVGTSSFNHYAFGCVDDWLFTHLAGVRESAPGFRESVITPDLDAPLDHVRARIVTPYGPLEARWRRREDNPDAVDVKLELPGNTSATVLAPPGWRCTESEEARFGSGRHAVRLVRG